MANTDLEPSWYNQEIEKIRNIEFPTLRDVVYLDHAGTAVPAKSLMDRFAIDMVKNLCANPHSTSVASQETSKRIDAIRVQLLQYFNADPEEYDLVFVANATAGIKLVAEALRDTEHGFWFGYHNAAHTSIIGMRELAVAHQSFTSDVQVEDWIDTLESQSAANSALRVFAYPAQSNMNGMRLPLQWCNKVRASSQGEVMTLLDAASLVSTSPLDLSSTNADFTVLSLYKIFGFPDLGALIVRKSTFNIFQSRKYFGGGTVDAVTCETDAWHVRKSRNLHERLEDGSLPIHNILAVESALSTHHIVFGDLSRISRHCAMLAQRLYNGLRALHHYNGLPVCELYHKDDCVFTDLTSQGPILALNIRDKNGQYLSTSEVEKLASVKHIQLRTGGLCNPGGVSTALKLSPAEVKENHANGQRCGSDDDLVKGRPTGMIRLSIGPTNTTNDVEKFLSFVKEFFVSDCGESSEIDVVDMTQPEAPFTVESLIVYPIKSCAGWPVPHDIPWTINQEGLAWDREWCLVAAGSGTVMNQKRHPKMALIHPVLDFKERLLRIYCSDVIKNLAPIAVPLTIGNHANLSLKDTIRDIRICEDEATARVYTSPHVNEFLHRALDVPCFLARFSPSDASVTMRHSKISRKVPSTTKKLKPLPEAFLSLVDSPTSTLPILLSNESPILIISRSSLNRLNEQIKSNGGRAAHASAFRANIVIAETISTGGRREEQPYVEDSWRMMKIGKEIFQLLGPCRRCQMVCVDQFTGVRHQEPFVTLAKTRRFDGMIFFGQHSCHVPGQGQVDSTITVGDAAIPIT